MAREHLSLPGFPKGVVHHVVAVRVLLHKFMSALQHISAGHVGWKPELAAHVFTYYDLLGRCTGDDTMVQLKRGYLKFP